MAGNESLNSRQEGLEDLSGDGSSVEAGEAFSALEELGLEGYGDPIIHDATPTQSDVAASGYRTRPTIRNRSMSGPLSRTSSEYTGAVSPYGD